MEKGLFCTFKKFIEEIKDEYKVYKKIGNSYRLKRIISIISEYGKDCQLYTFMMNSLANIDFEKIEYSYKGVTILDEKNNKLLKIMLLPNYKDVESIYIESIDNSVISRKEFSFLYGEINVKEYKEKDGLRIKTHRKYVDNQMIFEDVSRIKSEDNDNYYWISNTTHVDENDTAIMKEFIQIRKDGMIESQGVKFYRGHILDDASFYTRSAYNIDYLYDYLEEDKYQINHDRYYSELEKIEQKDSKIISFVPRKKG